MKPCSGIAALYNQHRRDKSCIKDMHLCDPKQNSLRRSNQPGLVIEFVHDRFIASSVDITFVYHDFAGVPANMFDLSAGDSNN